MKRSTLTRRAPLRRSGFQRKSPSASRFRRLMPRATLKRRSAIKQRIHSATVAEGAQYLAACRDEPCYLNVCCPWTGWADPTVVPCHSNQPRHGSGGGLKADHRYTVPGCHRCHQWLDFSRTASRAQRQAVFEAAYARWVQRRAHKMGEQA